jgi:hypothetical protein
MKHKRWGGRLERKKKKKKKLFETEVKMMRESELDVKLEGVNRKDRSLLTTFLHNRKFLWKGLVGVSWNLDLNLSDLREWRKIGFEGPSRSCPYVRDRSDRLGVQKR